MQGQINDLPWAQLRTVWCLDLTFSKEYDIEVMTQISIVNRGNILWNIYDRKGMKS